jgi:hypothetical protein
MAVFVSLLNSPFGIGKHPKYRDEFFLVLDFFNFLRIITNLVLGNPFFIKNLH